MTLKTDKTHPSSAAPPGEAGVPAAGDEAALADIPDAELTPAVRRALFPLRAEVEKLRAELAEARRRAQTLESLAYRDPLLGLFNRRAFMRELERAAAMADRYDENACVVFIDIDGMKAVNDAHGHRAGDAALKHVARILAANVRQTDAAARLGGDEFGLILTHTDKAFAQAKAARLAELVAAAPVEAGDAAFAVRISCGVAAIGKGASVDELMELADSAMYEHKRRKSS